MENKWSWYCLGNEQLLVPSCRKPMLIFKIWRKTGWILCRRSRFGKVGIPWKLLCSLNIQPSTLISPTGSSASISKVSGGHQLFNSLTEFSLIHHILRKSQYLGGEFHYKMLMIICSDQNLASLLQQSCIGKKGILECSRIRI